jgi:L-2-hydroxyglutarate oxidase
VTAIDENDKCVDVRTKRTKLKCNFLIACAGLQSDRIANISNIDIDFRIIPFRGEYFVLPENMNSIISHLIYPVPDPELPFLGIHLTKMIDGRITVGPNAALGFAREGYSKFSFSMKDSVEILGYSGFWNLMFKYRKHSIHEALSSISKYVYLNDCRKYCPSLTIKSLLPYRSGIRAQAVSSSGELLHDFIFKQTNKMLHVCNAPSPAATSAFPIGKMIADRIANSKNT